MSDDAAINTEKGAQLRTTFHEKLDALAIDLATMGTAAADAMHAATEALLEADLPAAERVIDADAEIDSLLNTVDQHCVELLALEAPVAFDLRLVIGSLRISSSLERMGDLAEHIAKQARMRYPEHVVPAELAPMFADMGRYGENITRKVVRIIETRDISSVAEIDALDSQVDRLHRDMFAVIQDPAWAYGYTTAIDLTLLSRYYERFSDHAVSVARRVVTIVTGAPYVGVRLGEQP